MRKLSLVFAIVSSDLKSTEKEARPRTAIHRRNTLDTIIFNEMCDKADKDYEDETKEDAKEGSRKSKRSLKLLRGNERDLKLDVEAAHNYAERYTGDMVVSTPNQIKVREREQVILSIGRVWKTQRLRLCLICISDRSDLFIRSDRCFPNAAGSHLFVAHIWHVVKKYALSHRSRLEIDSAACDLNPLTWRRRRKSAKLSRGAC